MTTAQCTVVQGTGADCSIVQSLDMMDNPLYSQHLKGDERDNEQDVNDLGARQGDERDYDQDAIDPGSRQDDEQDDDRDEINQRGGDVYEGGGAGLVVWVKDKGTGRSEGARAKRITRGLKVNVGGEELNLHHNTGSSTTIITPARYRESMVKVVAAKHYLRQRGRRGTWTPR